MGAEVFSLVKKKGLLLEKEIYELLVKIEEQKAIEFLEQIERISGQKFITKRVLENNISYLKNLVQRFNEEDKNVFDRIISDFSIYNGEESKKIIEEDREKKLFEVINSDTRDRKIEVSDFVNSFKLRFQQIQKILMSRAELQKDLISIGKISSYKSQLSAIGIVTEKTITKNKNILITIEDLTGSIRALVKFEDKETFRKAEEILLDDIIGIKAVGSKDILFVQDIFYPDIIFKDKVKFEEDFNIAFISDIHCGSDRHLSKSFNNFIEWLNSEDESAKKIKYLFIVGDNVDGVGVFPGQEKLLNVTSIKKQYELLANYLKNVPKNITMFLCPGQHDAVRVAEPQPIIGKKYGSALWEIENLILVTNPAMVKLFEDKKEFKILMYHGASLHSFINEIRELREIKAHGCPAKAVKHILKRRHLSPIHSEAIYIPNPEEDALIIKEVPDVLCTGEVHRLDIETYNGVLIITGSCWQAQTPFEEKVGNLPDPAKVPVLNLKTRELKVFDFS